MTNLASNGSKDFEEKEHVILDYFFGVLGDERGSVQNESIVRVLKIERRRSFRAEYLALWNPQ